MKKLTSAEQMWDPETQTFKRRDLPGPPDFDTWLRSWKVFKCACLLLEISKIEHSTPTATISVLSTRNTARSIGSSSSRQTQDSEKNPLNVGSVEKSQKETAQK